MWRDVMRCSYQSGILLCIFQPPTKFFNTAVDECMNIYSVIFFVLNFILFFICINYKFTLPGSCCSCWKNWGITSYEYEAFSEIYAAWHFGSQLSTTSQMTKYHNGDFKNECAMSVLQCWLCATLHIMCNW